MRKEIPILMSPPMVQAILDGLKTQTRRIVKGVEGCTFGHFAAGKKGYHVAWFQRDNTQAYFREIECPYGRAGDILYVKETYYDYGYWKKDGKSEKTGRQKWKFISTLHQFDPKGYCYVTGDVLKPDKINSNKQRNEGWYKRPSLFMPRKAARILLEKVATRIERVRDMTEADAAAEGLQSTAVLNAAGDDYKGWYASEHFQQLWEQINGPGSWQANPYVWVNEFRVHQISFKVPTT